MTARALMPALAFLLSCGSGNRLSGDAGLEPDLAPDPDGIEEIQETVDAADGQEDLAGDQVPVSGYWARSFSPPLGDDWDRQTVSQTQDSGFILNSGFFFEKVLRLESSGLAIWQAELAADSIISVMHVVERAGDFWAFSEMDRSLLIVSLAGSGGLLGAWRYTGLYADRDIAAAVALDEDGSLVVAGLTFPFDGRYGSAFMARMDPETGGMHGRGFVYREQDMDGQDVGATFRSMAKTGDGYIAAGERNVDGWAVRLDAEGNILWQRAYGTSNWDSFTSIAALRSGGFVAAGTTWGFESQEGEEHLWVVRLDDSGDIVWQKVYYGDGEERRPAVVEAPGGGYALAACNVLSEGYFGLIMKFDEGGGIVWQRTYSLPLGVHESGLDCLTAVTAAMDGGLVAAGTRGGPWVTWVLKVDENGLISPDCPESLGMEAALQAADTGVEPVETMAVPLVLDLPAVEVNLEVHVVDEVETETQCETF